MAYVQRLGYLGSRVSIQAACHSQSRLTAPVILHRTRPLPSLRPSGLSRNARSYWWSSSPKAPQEPVVAEETLPEQPATPEEPLLDTAAPAEGTSTAGDALQVSTGIPWLWTIVSATLITRVILFPFTVRSMRSTAALAPHAEEINKLRLKMQLAQETKDMLLLQQVVLKQRSIYEKAGVSMGSMALLPVVQLPITLGLFFGVKGLCDFPLEQLKYTGLSYLPDLTVADPTGTLPIAATVLINLQLTLGAREMMSSPQTAHLVNLFRVLSLVSVPLCWHLPSGTMVYIITSIIGLMAQSLVLRSTAIRRLLGIPIVQQQHQTKPATMMESVDFLKHWWQDKKKEQEAIIRARNHRR
ncbi:60Kd inner membrane protein-domain-containing protein [Fomitopsis serialis]|uniref:60Kd inner membrane protein-domain-containing protein n=1 Tax=Fomitopsis serialis TaxID=139415 RepID=UPI0020088EEE|nr:60Kd inner membrane protein-domain-containing protein [Neoantrodia serialis]KAH9922212.1 60Kd inner membrane protein-domain-containing protein [Neoantrodia serialis]